MDIEYKKHKQNLFALSLVIDALGMLSYLLPGIGEWTDIAMSIITALAIFKSFHSYGWAAFGFLEEILPFTDIIPSATIVWLYRYVFTEKETKARYLDRQNKKN